MFGLIKKVLILVLSTISVVSPNCLLLKNQECAVRKVITDNDCMTFRYKIKVDRCVGSWSYVNYVENTYFKVSLPDVVKNISVKSFDLISLKQVLKNISFYQSCKCGCLLDEKVCNSKQKWNKNKCRCECLEIKDCDVEISWNVINCICEMKKAAALIVEKECDVETNEKIECKVFPKNKTIIKKIEDCKPFATSSILFVCVSIIATGIMIYFCLKSSIFLLHLNLIFLTLKTFWF